MSNEIKPETTLGSTTIKPHSPLESLIFIDALWMSKDGGQLWIVEDIVGRGVRLRRLEGYGRGIMFPDFKLMTIDDLSENSTLVPVSKIIS